MPFQKSDRPRLERFYCIVCGEPIPQKRAAHKANTCCNEHAKDLKIERRRMRELTRCRLCNRPSSPEERVLFTAWRRSLGIKPGPKRKPDVK